MKLVEIIPSINNLGGVQTLAVSLCKEYATRYKEEISLFVIVLYNRKERSFYHELDELGVPVYYLGKSKGIDFKCYKKLRLRLEEIKPDLVHIHLNTSLSLFIASRFRKKYKVIQSLHNMADKSFRKETLNCYLAKRKWFNVVSVSQRVSDSFFVKTGIKTPIIENGIYTDKFANDIPMKERRNDFICIAAFRPVKNQKFIIGAFKAMNNPNANLTFIGDGPLLEEYKKYVKELSLDSQICFKGEIDNVQDYLKNTKMLLVGSISEANPIVINEAFAAGTYVIATNVGGIPDLVHDGVDGDIVELNNVEQLSKLMSKRLANPEYLEQQRLINKEKISTYSIENCAKKYFEFFKTIN